MRYPTMAASFDALAGLLPEPMLLVSSDGVVAASNGAFGTLIGLPAPQAIGRTLADLGWREPDRVAAYLRQCSRSRALVFGAASIGRADGTELSCRCEGACFSPREGDRPAVVLLRLLLKEQTSARFVALTRQIATLNDEVLRRQRAEHAAHHDRELLRVTLMSIGDAVIATDRSGHITFMNEVAERLTEWSSQEAQGRPIRTVFAIANEQTRQTVDDPVAAVLAHGKAVGLANHTVLIARDGTERPIDDSAAPIVDSGGELRGAVLVFRDVTARRAVERHHVAARRSAEAANRAKDEFLATLSHELRTPLNAILGWARILRQTGLEASRQAHGLEVIERNADAQAKLVEDLLDVSRIVSGQLRLQDDVVSVSQVIDAAADVLRPATENRNQRLSVHAESPLVVRGDAARLQQVVWNLLANAVKFTPPGGSIDVHVAEIGDHIHITVHDSGQGFPDSFRPFMFDAFSQADASYSRPHGGLGLGLTIARRLVEAHGGTIEGRSAGLNQGASFTVILPAAKGVTARTGEPWPARTTDVTDSDPPRL